MAQPNAWQRKIGQRSFLDYLQAQAISDRELAGILRDAAIEAERVVARTLGDGIGAQVRRHQYRLAALELRQQQASMWDAVSRSTRQGIERSSAVAAESQRRLAEFLARTAAQEGIDAAMLQRGFGDAAARTGMNVRARLLNGIDLSPRVYKNAALASGRVDRVVNRGIALNKSAREIARDVRYLIRPDTPGGVSYAAKRLGRTEINNAFHTTTIQSSVELPFVAGMHWQLSASHPRFDECDELAEGNHDGLGVGVFRPENVPQKPHPQCLCYVNAVTVEPDRFMNSLFNGEYDGWLQANGQMPIAGRATA